MSALSRMPAHVRARLVLACTLAVFLAAWAAPTAPAIAGDPSGTSDIRLFEGIVSSLRGGAPYYPTVGAALEAGHYPTASAFNWRTPVLWPALAWTPSWLAFTTRVSLGVLLMVLTVIVTRQSRVVMVAAAITQFGAVLAAVVPIAATMTDAWCGLLLGISAIALAAGRPVVGIGSGLLALFVRELAGPYCVAATVWAATQRRYRHVAAWFAGASVFALFYSWHLRQILATHTSGAAASGDSWLSWGGIPFLLGRLHMHGFLMTAPQGVVAATLAVLVSGLAWSSAPSLLRLAGAAYVVFFLMVGKPFNDYWGLVAWPIWAALVGFGVGELARDATLVMPARRSRATSVRRASDAS